MKKTVAAAFTIILCALFIYAVFVEPQFLRVERTRIPFRDLPREFNGFKIAVLSDLHYGFFMSLDRVARVVETANRLNADAIVCLGDLSTRANDAAELGAVWSVLKRLRARSGVYFVNGNHDHWAGDALSLRLLEESGFSVRHRHRYIRRGNARIAIGGCGDFYEDEPGIDVALRGVPAGVLRIMLAHNPDTANTLHDARVDLFLAGHTHGGQCVVPLIGWAPVLPVTDKDFDSGLRTNRIGEKVFISRGIGCTLLRARFNCMPEIAVIELVRDR